MCAQVCVLLNVSVGAAAALAHVCVYSFMLMNQTVPN